ncbi:MAG: acyl-CoA dehydrogenase family protein [Desulfobacteraceae bacterium]|nr:acyl-CoA dehydrogenase family protein [Desulfobacteraceae bacterium]
MESGLTEEQEMLKETVRRFAKNKLAPLAYEIDRDERFPSENYKKMAEMGLLGTTIPEEYGGSGGTYMDLMIVIEELSAVCCSTAVSMSTTLDLFSDNVYRNGSEHLRKKYLPDMCSGKTIGGLAMTEPGAGSDVISMTTRADLRNNSYIMNGTKTFISHGPVGDAFIVYAKTAFDKRQHGISAFVVEKDFPGFTAGKKFEKMGWRGSPTGELIFEDCIIPEDNLLGNLNEGVKVLMSGLNTERLTMGAIAVGIARGAYEYALDYAVKRTQFNKPIATFQRVQDKLVDMAMNIEAARMLVYKGTAMADNNIRGSECNLMASYAKLFSSEICMKATTEAVQILGGYGYIKEYPVERMMRDAKIMTIGGGTSEIQRMIIIKHLMKSTPL